MTLPEELRQASRYTALDRHRDLLERAAEKIEANEKDAARYRWLCETLGETQLPTLIERITQGYVADYKPSIDAAIDAALSTQGEKT